MIDQYPEELSIDEIKEALQQIEQWLLEARTQVPRINGKYLPEDFDVQCNKILRQRVEKENPRLIPLIDMSLSTDAGSELAKEERSVGKRMNDISYTDMHISGSTLWLFDSATDRVQTMCRVLVEDEQGRRKVIDVYSDPVSPAILKDGPGSVPRSNIAATIPSRYANLLRFVEQNRLTVKGWLDVS